MKRIARAFPALSVLSLALLTACGGGGGSGSTNTQTLAGKVIDGYIEGATVCLDLNANLVCDSGEPSATTKADGSYSLDLTGIAADKVKAAHLLTNVPATAKDADDGGKTLAEAGKSGFNLLAPAASYVATDGASVAGAVISPLTTLVSHEMISGNNTLLTSEKYVRERLNVEAGLDIRQDFVANKNAALTEKAQMLTAAIGQIKKDSLDNSTSKPTDKEALLAALTYLQTQADDLQAAYTAAKTANNTANPAALVKTALTTLAAKPDTTKLVAEAKKITDTVAVSSIVGALEQGLYGPGYACATSVDSNVTQCGIGYYGTAKGKDGNMAINRYVLDGTAWIANADSSSDLVLTSAGWVSEQTCSAGQSMTYAVDSAGITTVKYCNGRTEKVSARQVDAAGKTLAGLGVELSNDYKTLTMPANSTLYWLDFASQEDSYFLYAGSPVTKWVSSATTGGTYAALGSIDEIVNTFTTDGKKIFGWSGLIFTFNKDGTSTGGTVTMWSDYFGTRTTGSASYERRTVHGKEVLLIKAQPPYSEKGNLVMFSVKDGQVYGGSFRAAATKNSREAQFNKTMMNAILAAEKKPAVLN